MDIINALQYLLLADTPNANFYLGNIFRAQSISGMNIIDLILSDILETKDLPIKSISKELNSYKILKMKTEYPKEIDFWMSAIDISDTPDGVSDAARANIVTFARCRCNTTEEQRKLCVNLLPNRKGLNCIMCLAVCYLKGWGVEQNITLFVQCLITANMVPIDNRNNLNILIHYMNSDSQTLDSDSYKVIEEFKNRMVSMFENDPVEIYQ
jgi:hypothetical protein